MAKMAYTGINYEKGMDYNIGTTEKNGIDWKLTGFIAGGIILGIVVGIFLGKRSVKKR